MGKAIVQKRERTQRAKRDPTKKSDTKPTKPLSKFGAKRAQQAKVTAICVTTVLIDLADEGEATAPASGDEPEVPAKVDELFESDDEKDKKDLEKLATYDAACQHGRNKMKEVMAVKKTEAAKDKQAKAAAKAKAKEAKAKEKEAKAAAKAKAKEAKAKEKEAKAAAKAKAKAKKAGGAATATDPPKSRLGGALARKAKEVRERQTHLNKEKCTLKIGSKVCAYWKGTGQWYPGHIHSIDYTNCTANVLFEDGDTDPAIPWSMCSLDDSSDDDDSDVMHG